MNLIHLFLIQKDDDYFIIGWWQKIQLTQIIYESLQKQWIPTIYVSDVECV